ncbi:MAG: hypothetical protein IKO14_05125 [Oscillibacter sp.]|nr:hypothetical protein [Oscillibacter sp.]
MPALLGPTNPVPGYDQQPVRITTPPPTDTSVQNIVDPERVVRPDSKSERQDNADTSGATRYESNYMTFLQRLRGARDLPEVFMRILQWGGVEVSSGIRSGFAQEMSQFLEFLRMDEAQLLEFLKNQLESGSRFTGPLFGLIRDAYNGTSSEMARSDILQFLRRYSDFSSTEHLEGKLLRETQDMTESLPSQWGDQVKDILAKLQSGVEAGDRQGNLNLLREKLFPLIARYVTTTHDHGRARQILSMMTLDIARYENGDTKGLLHAFRHLASMGVLPDELGKLSDADILRLLKESDFAKAAQNNEFAAHMAELTNAAIRGEAGANTQEAFRNMMAAMLINESVYMPLNHVILPLDWNGKKMFAEMWVDPDVGGTRQEYGDGDFRILIKLDIESLGAFDLLFDAHGSNVNLQVACPAVVAPHAQTVSAMLAGILARNGLRPENVTVAEMRRPIAISEVFPKILAGMTGINVRV